MMLRELIIELTREEYEQLHKPIHGSSHFKTLMRRLQPYINMELKPHNRIHRGVVIKITDLDLIEFCVKYRVYGMKGGGFKRGSEAVEQFEKLRQKSEEKRSADEKDRRFYRNATVGRKASNGNLNPV